MRRGLRSLMGIQPLTLKERIAKAEEGLRQWNLKGLVVCGHGSALGNMTNSHGYLRYLCNWNGHNSFSVLILLPEREPILLSPSLFAQFLARDLMWFDDVRYIKPSDLGPEVVSILKQAGITEAQMGFVGRAETPVIVWEALEHGLPDVEWVDFAPYLDELRIKKGELDIAYHQRAAEVCDKLFEMLAREIKKGKRGYELIADVEHMGRYEGCEYSSCWLTIGPVADYYQTLRNEDCFRVPQPGDQVLSGLYVMYKGYWGHANRAAVIGPPNDVQREAFAVALEMQEAMLEKLKPGGDLNDVDIAAEKVFRKHYPDFKERKIFRFRAGHGIGYSYNEPLISNAFRQHCDNVPERPDYASSPLEIKPGMLFVLHPNFFVPNVAAAQVGDMVVVTETAYEFLTCYPRELLVW